MVSAVNSFIAGNIANHVSDWELITSDLSILETVRGYKIEFDSTPVQSYIPCVNFSKGEEVIIDTEIDRLLNKGVICRASHCEGEFISTVFTRPKKEWIT